MSNIQQIFDLYIQLRNMEFIYGKENFRVSSKIKVLNCASTNKDSDIRKVSFITFKPHFMWPSVNAKYSLNVWLVEVETRRDETRRDVIT